MFHKLMFWSLNPGVALTWTITAINISRLSPQLFRRLRNPVNSEKIIVICGIIRYYTNLTAVHVFL